MARSAALADRPSKITSGIGAAMIGSGLAFAVLASWRRAGGSDTTDRAGRAGGGGGHGRAADTPAEIPRAGWRDILTRVWNDLTANNVGLMSAGVAFYALMGLFPALAAMVALYGLVADVRNVQHIVELLNGILPGEAADLIGAQLATLVAQPSAGLSIAGLVALALALWSARNGATALITALNVVYRERERRGFLHLALLTLGMTLAAIVSLVVAFALVAAVPALLSFLPIGGVGKLLGEVLRWPLLAVLAMVGLAMLYRYGPSRDHPKWRWVSWGSVAATVLWLAASALFSVYVTTMGSYDKTYGAIGGVIVLLMWFYISLYVVLAGAELNAEMEHQTARDTTEGKPMPMGARRAHMADSVGETATAARRQEAPDTAERMARASGA